jgi:phytoene/squalene synthetase
VLNHLQDCVADHRDLDRVYLPTEVLARFGSSIEDLDQRAATPGLRAALDHLLDRTAELVREARGLPPHVVSPGLRRETAVIVSLAERLTQRLRRGDPVAGRVKLTPYDFGASVLVGLWRGRQSRRLP